MFKKIAFQNQEERDDFEKYRQLKGDDLYFQICRILSENDNPVNYVTVQSHIRYDKNLRDKLYIYLATLEEYCRAQLLNRFDVREPKKYTMHCYKMMLQNLIPKETAYSTLYYGFQPDFGDLMHICNEKQVWRISDTDQKSIKQLRNDTMHHALLLFGNSKTISELNDHLTTLEKRLNVFVRALPEEYQQGFLSDIRKLNHNKNHLTTYLSRFYLEVQDGRICIKK